MADSRDQLGTSGVFQKIVMSARKLTRALSEGGADPELAPDTHDYGNAIAQAFVAGRFRDVHAMTIPSVQQRTACDAFESSWREAVAGRGPFTGFEISDAGEIDLGFIPGLEDVPQDKFVAFLELAFSSPEVAIEDDAAFTVGAVLLFEGGEIRIGALHLR